MFCHFFSFSLARRYFGILIKTSSARQIALIAGEFICWTAGEAAVILKHILSLYSPEDAPVVPVDFSLFMQVQEFDHLDSPRGPHLRDLCMYIRDLTATVPIHTCG